MKVTAELLPEHPILMLRAAETDTTMGIHHGEVLAHRCIECGAADEDVREIIHEGDCDLEGKTAPTAYSNRREADAFPDSEFKRERLVADGGN